jgi:hypothetical protein
MSMRLCAVVLCCCCLAGRCPAGEEPLVLVSLHGTVRDADGKPIAGAVVRLRSTQGYTETRGGTEAIGGGKTDSQGKYKLSVYTKPHGRVAVRGVSAQARGFVRFLEDFVMDDGPVLLPGKSAELNIVLGRGEGLAGTFEVPLSNGERRMGITRADQQVVFAVVGPSFRQYYMTEKGCTFEAWVPPGRYTVELAGDPRRAHVRKENVPSGTRGLKLALVEPPVSEEVLGRAFDALWDDMDRYYSYFDLKKVDWKALKERYRRQAVAGRTLRGLVGVLEEMLAELHDGHVWIVWPEGTVYQNHGGPARPTNYNREATLAALNGVTWCGDFAVVGKTKGDGFGALILMRQSKADAAGVRKAVDFIRSTADAPGFLVDLRDANGGNELFAREIARQFCGKDVVYAKSKFRDGPGHGAFGPAHDRVLKASDKPFVKPVVCLVGPRAVSSGEGFVQMMKCLPHVTTVGTRTRGSSGNPAPFQLPGVAVTVFYSRWVDLMPDGTPIEDAGIAPEVELNFPAKAYAEKDPTWEKALELLRKKAAPSRR